jgi:hypothetical protein
MPFQNHGFENRIPNRAELVASSKPQPICFRKTEVAANPSALLLSYKELR